MVMIMILLFSAPVEAREGIVNFLLSHVKEMYIIDKQIVIDGIRALPDDATWDDVMYFLYVNQKIEKGLNDIKAGNVLLQNEVREKLKKQ
jgi:hypothetical protein